MAKRGKRAGFGWLLPASHAGGLGHPRLVGPGVRLLEAVSHRRDLLESVLAMGGVMSGDALKMSRGDFYSRTLPAEFAPPDKAAEQLAALSTRAEREAYWLRIPEAWRPAVEHHAKQFIGLAIAEMPGLELRRAALEQVPAMWREEVEWHLKRLWNTKDLRAMSEGEFYVAYPDERRKRAAA